MVIPNPYPGLVINHKYLWKIEKEDGKQDGEKYRPSCIVASVKEHKDGSIVVLTMPITHSPQKTDEAVKIPPEILKNTKLDGEDQWVVCSEVNKFVWTGDGLKAISRKEPDTYDYGTIPDSFLKAIKAKAMKLRQGGKFTVVERKTPNFKDGSAG